KARSTTDGCEIQSKRTKQTRSTTCATAYSTTNSTTNATGAWRCVIGKSCNSSIETTEAIPWREIIPTSSSRSTTISKQNYRYVIRNGQWRYFASVGI